MNEGELALCVACGLCLPHCPTYRVTGEESASPRGRIAAMRLTMHGELPLEGEFTSFIDLCIQCQACGAVCPSLVPFGRLMEGARATLAEETDYQPRLRRIGLGIVARHRLLLGLSSAAAIAQRLRLLPKRMALSRLKVRRPALRASVPAGRIPRAESEEVWLFTGCVMDAWMRPTHLAVQRVIEATGARVAFPLAGGDCCGALHVHGGLLEQARSLAHRVMDSMPGEATVVVDSAGCGAQMKAYGELVGTEAAERFAARVRDVHEWLATRLDRLPAGRSRLPFAVAVQDPCHLRHVQRVHQHVRTVLAPYADLVELDDDGLCCGGGGAYLFDHPDMAKAVRARKTQAIARSRAPVVASANPGCAMWLSAAGLDVRHPLELIDEALRA
ncbi:MAG: (Fe-S)-binding protein [Acidobacteria bacterium]|nr:(Fe-S)-binding protein [Acidobacteriota bacterium]